MEQRITEGSGEFQAGQDPNGAAEHFRRVFGLEKTDIRTYSPLTLAYLGDAVYELVIRSFVTQQGNTQTEKLHHRSSEMVRAHTQSELARVLQDELTEEEITVYKRGRNAHSYTKAKHAALSDYRRATGFEALIGYLYLAERYDRILELVQKGLTLLEMI